MITIPDLLLIGTILSLLCVDYFIIHTTKDILKKYKSKLK